MSGKGATFAVLLVIVFVLPAFPADSNIPPDNNDAVGELAIEQLAEVLNAGEARLLGLIAADAASSEDLCRDYEQFGRNLAEFAKTAAPTARKRSYCSKAIEIGRSCKRKDHQRAIIANVLAQVENLDALLKSPREEASRRWEIAKALYEERRYAKAAAALSSFIDVPEAGAACGPRTLRGLCRATKWEGLGKAATDWRKALAETSDAALRQRLLYLYGYTAAAGFQFAEAKEAFSLLAKLFTPSLEAGKACEWLTPLKALGDIAPQTSLAVPETEIAAAKADVDEWLLDAIAAAAERAYPFGQISKSMTPEFAPCSRRPTMPALVQPHRAEYHLLATAWETFPDGRRFQTARCGWEERSIVQDANQRARETRSVHWLTISYGAVWEPLKESPVSFATEIIRDASGRIVEAKMPENTDSRPNETTWIQFYEHPVPPAHEAEKGQTWLAEDGKTYTLLEFASVGGRDMTVIGCYARHDEPNGLKIQDSETFYLSAADGATEYAEIIRLWTDVNGLSWRGELKVRRADRESEGERIDREVP